ncbi:MAG: PAS domain-containing protein [Planctomycetota bacterium]|nr:PAS domain-containing protein [Planctomycetota bacterium]
MPESSSSSPEGSGNARTPPPGDAGPAMPGETFQESLAELTVVYATVPVALLIVDPDFRVRRVNAVAARLAGRTEEEMIGLLPGESLQCLHHLDDPAGCGAGPHCVDCPVRLAVRDTLATGASHGPVELPFPQNGDPCPQEAWLSVSASSLFRVGSLSECG